MVHQYMKAILLVTGLITMVPGLQFLAPGLMLQQQGLAVSDDTGMFFARHWGLVVCCIGALLAYSAGRHDIRRPVVTAGMIQKAGLVILVALNWSNPALQGLHPAAIFDAVCVVLYAMYLFTSGRD